MSGPWDRSPSGDPDDSWPSEDRRDSSPSETDRWSSDDPWGAPPAEASSSWEAWPPAAPIPEDDLPDDAELPVSDPWAESWADESADGVPPSAPPGAPRVREVREPWTPYEP